MVELMRHQRRFVRSCLRQGRSTRRPSAWHACEGKSELAAHILERCLTPGHKWHKPGAEYLSRSLPAWNKRGNTCSGRLRSALEPSGAYRFIDSAYHVVGIVHKASNTRLTGDVIERKDGFRDS